MATSRLDGKSGENSPHLQENIEGGKSKKTNAECLLHSIKRTKNEKTSKRKK